MEKMFFAWGGVLGFLGVTAGAFGTHALKDRLHPEFLNVFEIAVRYQLIHALLLLIIGVSALYFPGPVLVWAGWCILAGVSIFSGSLYALALSGVRFWGALTPLGGLFMLAGWFLLMVRGLKS